MKRWIAAGAALVIAVVALLLALGGTLNHTNRHERAAAGVGHGHAATGSRTTSTTTPARASDETPARLDTDVPTTQGAPGRAALATGLTRALAPAGPQTGAFVYDLAAHAPLYARRAAIGRPPASVEKLWTTTALLARLGPTTRLHTAVLGRGRKRGAVWHGDLYLRGGGDPTFGDAAFNRTWNEGAGPTPDELAGQLRRRGIRRVTGQVYADDSLFDRLRGGLITDYRPDTPDFGGYLSSLTYDHGTTAPHYGDPATFAAHMLGLSLRAHGIDAHAAKRPRRAPADAELLAQVSSPTLQRMTRLMDVPSDDLYAEMLTKQLGVLFGGGGTISSGARVIRRTIAAGYGLHPRILDGSGLGRDDRTSPLQIVELLAGAWKTPTGRRLAASLPTVGVDGTVKGIAPKTAATGRCIAKTGTLNDVTNLAGYCTSRGGHPIAFGLFVDGPDNASAFAMEGRMLAAIARY